MDRNRDQTFQTSSSETTSFLSSDLFRFEVVSDILEVKMSDMVFPNSLLRNKLVTVKSQMIIY